MFQGQKGTEGKKNRTGIVAGYDLGRGHAQISYFCPEDKEPVTVSAMAGTEQYNIPAALCKRTGVGQWYYGKEAVKAAAEEKGTLVEDLLLLAKRGEEVMVEGESYDPVALLTLFVKRSLSMLTLHVPVEQVEAFLFTVEDLSPRMVEVLGKVAAGLQLPTQQIYFQNHLESFYSYILYQEQELWNHDVLIFEYDSIMKQFCLECNQRTTPRVVFIESREYPAMKRYRWQEDAEERELQKVHLDQEFLRIAEECLEGRIVSTVYLLGDGFKEDWARESLRMLCRTRRVFQGNNLYSKGACYGMRERLSPGEQGKKYVYLGEDKLKSNIGMEVVRRGEDSYFAVLDAGTNWYEAAADFDLILESGNQVTFRITPLTGGTVSYRTVTLEGLPERPRSTTRLNIHIEMNAVDQAAVRILDLGFGELFKTSGKGWTQTLQI